MVDIKNIIHCPLFFGVKPENLKELLGSIHYQVKKIKKGNVVVTSGEKVNNLYIISKGSVKGEMLNYSGKVVKIEDIEAPNPLATAFMFGENNKYPVTVTANNDVIILSIPIEEFLKILQKNATILVNYLNTISTRAQFLSQKIHFLNFKTIKGKIAQYLLQKAGDRFHSIELKETQQQLADLFGVTRPSLARVFSDLQKDGFIKIEKRTVTLLDKSKLNQLL